MDVASIREKALVNFEILLLFWNLTYKKITEYEYDILATWRKDENFGGCRFNIKNARGADFAGGSITDEDIANSGLPFEASDYSGYSAAGQAKIGFDIIGLAQRVHRSATYKIAAEELAQDLDALDRSGQKLAEASAEAAKLREQAYKEDQKRKQKYALDLWESAKYFKYEGSIGEKYLNNRECYIKEPNVRFHPRLPYLDKSKRPGLLFKVQKDPIGKLVAVHRIFLDPNGKKAEVDNPKMALASVKGCGIWFGDPHINLYIAEGPENALLMRQEGAEFVVSTIFASNFHNIVIPITVRRIILCSDNDKSGNLTLERAREEYQKFDVKIYEGRTEDKDYNDTIIRLRGKNGR